MPAPAPTRRQVRRRTGSGDPRRAPAFELAATGVNVFVLGRSKRPVANCPTCRHAATESAHDREACGCLTCHGFYAATTDPDRLTAILTAIPDGLLAIRTGAISGRVVIDIDPRHGGHLDPDLMTPTAAVRSGGADSGWHLHYRHPGPYLPSRPLPGHVGVDVKADGGYVVVPPAIHPDTRRPYVWVGSRPVDEMPLPLVTACQTPVADTPSEPAPDARPVLGQWRPGGRGISSPRALLAACLDTIAAAPQGQRRPTLYGASRRVAAIVHAGALTYDEAYDALYTAGRAAGQTDREARTAITGAFTAEGLTQ